MPSMPGHQFPTNLRLWNDAGQPPRFLVYLYQQCRPSLWGIVQWGTLPMIAKPKHSESQIRFQISELEKMLVITPAWMQSSIRYQIQKFNKRLSKCQAWRKQERRLRAIHQRPSVRRHIARKVKMPL